MGVLLLFILYFYIFLSRIFVFFLTPKPKKQTILFLENFPIENAGYQQRSYKWGEILKNEGYKVQVFTIFENKIKYDKIREKKSQHFFLIVALIKRFRHCILARKYSTVIVRRELLFQNDYGNLFLEKMLLKLNKNVILDFDDDISAAKRQPKKITNLFAKLMFENGNKFNESLRLYQKFIVGSEYLKSLIQKQSNNKVIEVIPTCVDTKNFIKKTYQKHPTKNQKINIGWIGGNQNLKYLDLVIEPLNKLQEEFNIQLSVVSGKKFTHSKAKFDIINYQWSLQGQFSYISNFDIGIMPLFENNVSKGKCSFKLIQYMASGLISIGSDIGSNKELIENNVNGFLTENKNWYFTIKRTIESWENFQEMSNLAVKRINNNYTFKSNKHKIINLLI